MQFHTHLDVHYMDFICHNRPEGSAYTAGTRAYHADRVYRAASEPHATTRFMAIKTVDFHSANPVVVLISHQEDLNRASIGCCKHDRN